MSGALGERFDIVLFMGVAYHLRHPLLALDLLWEHVADDVLVFQSMQRGSTQVLEPPPGHGLLRHRGLRRARLAEAALHRAALRRRPDELVGAQQRLHAGHAALRRLPAVLAAGDGGLPLPAHRARGGRRAGSTRRAGRTGPATGGGKKGRAA